MKTTRWSYMKCIQHIQDIKILRLIEGFLSKTSIFQKQLSCNFFLKIHNTITFGVCGLGFILPSIRF